VMYAKPYLVEIHKGRSTGSKVDVGSHVRSSGHTHTHTHTHTQKVYSMMTS